MNQQSSIMHKSRIGNQVPSDVLDQFKYEEYKRQQYLKYPESSNIIQNWDNSANGQKQLNGVQQIRQHSASVNNRAEKANLTCPDCGMPLNNNSPNSRALDTSYKLQSAQAPHNCVRSLKEKVDSLQQELANSLSQEKIADILSGYISKDEIPNIMKKLELLIEEKLEKKYLSNGAQKSAPSVQQYPSDKQFRESDQNSNFTFNNNNNSAIQNYPGSNGQDNNQQNKMSYPHSQEMRYQSQIKNQYSNLPQKKGDPGLLNLPDSDDDDNDHKAYQDKKTNPKDERVSNLKCTQSHPLNFISIKNQQVKFLCSVCKQLPLTVDDYLLSCQKCHFNVCQKCEIKITQMNGNPASNRGTGARQYSCIKSHPFKIQKYNLEKIRCNMCKEFSINNGNYTKNCQECDFDVCQRCDNMILAVLNIPQEQIPSSKDVLNVQTRDKQLQDQNRKADTYLAQNGKYLCKNPHQILVDPISKQINLSCQRCEVCSKIVADQGKFVFYCQKCEFVICHPCKDKVIKR